MQEQHRSITCWEPVVKASQPAKAKPRRARISIVLPCSALPALEARSRLSIRNIRLLLTRWIQFGPIVIRLSILLSRTT